MSGFMDLSGKVVLVTGGNGGIGLGGFVRSFTQLEADDWRRMLTNNLDSVFFTLREAVRHMVDRGEGGSLAATGILHLFNHSG